MNRDFTLMSAIDIIRAILADMVEQEGERVAHEEHVVEGSLSPVIDDPAYLLSDHTQNE